MPFFVSNVADDAGGFSPSSFSSFFPFSPPLNRDIHCLEPHICRIGPWIMIGK